MHDGTDLTAVRFERGTYDVAGLDSLYTGNDARARLVLAALRDRVSDVGRMRALGFCVSVAHAQYMARVFGRAGVLALAVHGGTPTHERERAFAALRAGEVRCLFAVDLFNEGLDLPDVDTLLMLRPTQSATVFLQQLGRGLRRAPGKAVLTVLALFIGGASAPTARPLRRPLPGTDRHLAHPARARRRARVPLPAAGLATRARPGQPADRARQREGLAAPRQARAAG